MSCGKLNTLLLTGNFLKEVPIGALGTMEISVLGLGSRLAEVPPEIAGLTQAHELRLPDNQLEQVPYNHIFHPPPPFFKKGWKYLLNANLLFLF